MAKHEAGQKEMENHNNRHTRPNTVRTYSDTLLLMRFSALGDVAMTVPVVKALAEKCPDTHIVFASRPFAATFYDNLADNVTFLPIDLKDKRYKGLTGMERLYQTLAGQQPDQVIDLHDVLRTKYARMRFRIAGIPVSCIDKHRSSRRLLTRQGAKAAGSLPTAFENYAAAIAQAGRSILIHPERQEILKTDSSTLSPHAAALCNKIDTAASPAVGIAPFAAHTGKIYPLHLMEEVIRILVSRHPGTNILLFGGGAKEKAVFDTWCGGYENMVFASARCNGMKEELTLISRLDCMVSMDSANMHLASLVGTPVVSVWGATHPAAGFLGWGQSLDDTVQTDLDCRPCSIYGNKACKKKDYPCLCRITPDDIVRKIEAHLR